jgi:T-complex protein 1 subunit gamma
MLKMLIDLQGNIVLTNDGNSILREINVHHPAAKCMISLARTQDENVGDGTTSVTIIANEMLQISGSFLEKLIHPTLINKAYNYALADSIQIMQSLSREIDVNRQDLLISTINSCVGTKFTSHLGKHIAKLAIESVNYIKTDTGFGREDIEVKKYIKVEKIPGGTIEDSQLMRGVMINKDVVNPSRMRRKIVKPRILLLDCPLEYKKGENMTNVELKNDEDFVALLKMEENWTRKVCERLLSFKPDIIITEKGLSDLAIHFLQRAGVSAIRRVRKTDNVRIARACGATIIHRPDELKETDIGTLAGIFDVRKLGDDFYSYITDCLQPKACTIILRGASKDILNDVERNLKDAVAVARNIFFEPRILPGGGAVEIEIGRQLMQNSLKTKICEQWPFRGLGVALEVIPRTIAQNCGVNVVRAMAELRAKHLSHQDTNWGIDGHSGVVKDMQILNIWDLFIVKTHAIKTAVETTSMLLRADEILSSKSQEEINSKEMQEECEAID